MERLPKLLERLTFLLEEFRKKLQSLINKLEETIFLQEKFSFLLERPVFVRFFLRHCCTVVSCEEIKTTRKDSHDSKCENIFNSYTIQSRNSGGWCAL